LSDFLARLQARLNRRLQSTSDHTSASPAAASMRAKIGESTSAALAKLKSRSSAPMRLGMSPRLDPALVARPLQFLGMAITAMALTYWILQWWQLPSVPSVPSLSSVPSIGSSSNPSIGNKNNPGITLYANQDSTAAYDLFGNKPVSTDTIFLRGVVATGKNANGSLDGFAIFEMDGKPTNAISIGESLGKGLTLQSIGDESATLLYQGQKLEFKLSKPGGQKATNPKKK
jgi:hypothetical protein